MGALIEQVERPDTVYGSFVVTESRTMPYTREEVEALVAAALEIHNEAQGNPTTPKLLWPLLDHLGRSLAAFDQKVRCRDEAQAVADAVEPLQASLSRAKTLKLEVIDQIEQNLRAEFQADLDHVEADRTMWQERWGVEEERRMEAEALAARYKRAIEDIAYGKDCSSPWAQAHARAALEGESK